MLNIVSSVTAWIYYTDCGNLNNPSGGRVTVTATTYNEEAEYECVIGYYISGGSTQRTCQADGTWNGTELQCTIYGLWHLFIMLIVDRN